MKPHTMKYAITPISHVVREMHWWLTFAIFCGADISGKLVCVTSPNDVIIHQLFRNARVAYPKACLRRRDNAWRLATIVRPLRKRLFIRWRQTKKVDSENSKTCWHRSGSSSGVRECSRHDWNFLSGKSQLRVASH